MSWEKEVSVTIFFGALVLAFTAGLLYYRLEEQKTEVRTLQIEVDHLRSVYESNP